MGLKIEYEKGQTPLDEEESQGLLIKTISTRKELDEFEQQNIEKAIEWTLSRKFKPAKIASEDFIKELHYKMYGEVWKWAGEFRHSNKNIGCNWQQVGTLLKQLNDDLIFWIANKTYPDEEIAIRYKHRIVSIHCFPNGNGRHSRLIADIIITHVFSTPVFSWGAKDLNKNNEVRNNYITALKKADAGDVAPLVLFSHT
ncbi:MAG TPA: mobile mystery protein B [Bacteroidia bacterium]